MSVTVTPSTFEPSPDGAHYAPPAPGRTSIDEYDYVESEWFASGDLDGTPYRTTVLARLPRDPKRFSGTVIVEPLHASGIAPIWIYVSSYLMQAGHAWIMVGSQKGPIEDHVRPSDPERYTSVVVEGPDHPVFEIDISTPEERAAMWAALTERNRNSPRILAQVGEALRAGGGPLRELTPQHILLAGHSQTGSAVTRYITEAHGSYRRVDGSSVYDGYFPSGFPAKAFRGIDVPVIQVMSDGDVSDPNETFSPEYGGRAYRREDSDEPGDRFRLYELAGVPHMTTRYAPYNSTELWAGVAGKDSISPDTIMSSLPHNELFSVAMHHLVEWVVNDTTPPVADRLVVGEDGWFSTDEHGNTLGGVRCAQMDVPRAQYLPTVPVPEGSLTFSSVGSEVPFTGEKLVELYGDASTYRKRFEQRVDELVAEGWLLPQDVEAMTPDAQLEID